MTINWQSVTGGFNDRLWDFLKALEAPTLDATLVNGNLTIGLGFDLRTGKEELLRQVRVAMGVNPGAIDNPAANSIEQNYFDQLGAAFSGTDPAALNSIMAARHDNSDPNFLAAVPVSNRRTTFHFNDINEVHNVYNAVVELYLADIAVAWPTLSFLNDSDFIGSRERLALASMVWNGGKGILQKSKSLRYDLELGNRAEAWFEIRYATNPASSVQNGIAKRRYAEAAIFGLYDNNVSTDDAKDVYRMLQLHRGKIELYEAQFSPQIGNANSAAVASGIIGVSVQDLVHELEPARTNLIDYLKPQYAGYATTLDAFAATDIYLDPGRDNSKQSVNSNHASILNGDVLVARNELLIGEGGADALYGWDGDDMLLGQNGNDLLVGGAGQDILMGEDGADTLDGGAGTDTLNGGSGQDIYIWNSGDGSDTIVDPDGGELIINGQDYHFGGGTMTKDPADNTWRDPSGHVLLKHNSPWRIELSDGSVIQLGDSFDPAQWNITLQDQPAAPVTTLVQLHDPQTQPIDVWAPSPQWPLSGGGSAADFTGTAASELIFGGDAQDASGLVGDHIDGAGGDDFILSGRGHDVINGGAGNDYIRASWSGTYSYGQNANSGLPLIIGGNGWGILNAGSGYIPLNWSYLGYSTSYTGGDDGNVIDGGAGNDDIDSGGGADVVHGGSDDDGIRGNGQGDTLYGDDGNDKIYGDGFDSGATAIEVTLLSAHGADVIDGGLGNDMLVGQGQSDTLFGGEGDDFLDGDETDLTNTPAANHGDDYLDGGSGNDTLMGNAGNDMLFGGAGVDSLWGDNSAGQLPGQYHGQDTLSGEAGNDQLVGGGNDDVLLGGADDDTLFGDDDPATLDGQYHGVDLLDGEDGDDQLVGGGKDDTLFGGAGSDTLFGDASSPGLSGADSGEDFLDGGDGVDSLVGGAKTDTLFGGAGNDTLQGDGAVSAVAGADQGDDYLDGEDGDDTLFGDGGVDTLIGGAGNDNLYGDSSDTPAEFQGDDYLDGGENDDILVGGGGGDTLIGGSGVDQLYGDASDTPTSALGDDYLEGGAGADTLVGAGGSDILLGGSENDVLFGDSSTTPLANQGNDYLDGGTGADAMVGGAGNDTYIVDDAGDSVSEGVGAGIDQVQSSVSYTLGSNVENLVLTGTSAINATGNTLDNVLTGNLAANTLSGGSGNDTYIVDNAGDVVVDTAGVDIVQSSISYALGNSIENLTLTGGAAINGTGNASNNVLTGNSAVNILTGSLGDDIYVVNNSGDAVIENLNEGMDLVQSSVTYTLSSNVENLTLTGISAIDATGNALDNVLTGNSAVNSLTGGAGNDTYVVDNAGDTVIEAASDGVDLVQSSIDYALDGNVENLTLTGASAVNGAGNALDNILLGNSATNVLTGGTGNDVYGVDNSSDVVIENADEGVDRVLSSISYTLGNNLENLTLTNVAPNGAGNALDNILIGNNYFNTLTGGAGNDVLDGALAPDTLIGGAGDDTYFVDSGGGDVIIENANEGIDLVNSEWHYVLSDNVENLTLIGPYSINGTGNASDNVLRGNSANNILDGAAGADTLIGGLGNDTYVVDNIGDVAAENASEGTDSVQASVSYALANNVENLTLTGTQAINATGNALDNVLLGNSAANTLTGGLGNDTYGVDNSGDVIVENANEGVDLVQSSISYTLGANIESLTLTGAAAINGVGNALDNLLIGNSAANTLTGGLGNDTYGVDNSGDVIVENANEGLDLVQSSITYTLGANVENLTLTGNSLISGAGNDLDNVLTGNVSTNTLSGGLGNDTYVVQTSADAIVENANEGTDLVLASQGYTLGNNVENLTLTGVIGATMTGNSQDNVITGNTAANTLNGGGGNDTLIGGGGADTLVGGTGNDTYVVDSANDVVTELTNEGTDLVQSSVAYGISATVENLTLTGSANINGTGNAFVNTLIGNSGNNTLNGFGGADAMSGGAGDDIYVVDDAADTVSENAGQGVDLVQSSVAYTLGIDVENLTLTGTAAINGVGNAANNIIVGNSAINTLTGGLGDDTYYVNTYRINFFWSDSYELRTFLDIVPENSNEGYDTIVADHLYSVSLPDNFEKLVISGALTGYGVSWNLNEDVRRKFIGNGVDNVIDASFASSGGFALGTIGTGGFDEGEIVIDGGAGADVMIGPNTNLMTRYIVDNPGDVITITGTRIDDRVETSISYTLPTGADYIDLVGTTAISATGNAGNNRLDGRQNTAGNQLIGGSGDDTYYLGSGDTYVEMAGGGSDTLVIETLAGNPQNAYDVNDFQNIENLTVTDAALTATLRGNDVDNRLTGNAFDNLLTGGLGNDQLSGGAGNDTYDGFATASGTDLISDSGGSSDWIRFSSDQNIDVAQLQFSRQGNNLIVTAGPQGVQQIQGWFTSAGKIENLSLYDQGLYYAYSAAQIENRVLGVNTAPVFQGLGSWSTDSGQLFSVVVPENAFSDIESQHALNYTATLDDGSPLPSWLSFDAQSRTLSGTPAAADQGSFNVLITTTDAGGLMGSGLVTLDVFPPTIYGTAGDDVLTGDETDNYIDGLAGNDVLNGLGGWDYLNGGSGNDSLYGGDGEDYLDDYEGGNDSMYGGVDNDYMQDFGGGNDLLDGGAGADEMWGGAGSDIYIVDDANDIVQDDFYDSGIDEVRASVSVSLTLDPEVFVGVENLTLLGSTAIDATGNGGNNVLTGNSGNNILTGLDGNDTLDGGTAGTDSLRGGLGNDIYLVDRSSGISITENSGQGTDEVRASVTYTLGSNLENLTLLGTGNINGTGNSLANTIAGNSGNNTLSGGTGVDQMSGGAGNDIFVVDNAGDVAIENAGEGTDLVQSAVTFTLGANIENLTLTGSSAANGTGNTLDNVLTGNSGNNTLTGLAGNDTLDPGSAGTDVLVGGQGNDTYTVTRTTGITLTENASEGTDLVNASVAYTLGNNLENLTLTGSSALNGTGNTLDNVLTGNSGSNTLTGLGGNDTLDAGSAGTDVLLGGLGDDTYIVARTSGITITENASEGTDSVLASVTHTLATNVENLTLTGSSTINGTGNALANVITGNSANNTLDGLAGADTLIGGVGNDTYTVDNTGDVVTENASEGTDLVNASATYTLGNNVENLTLTLTGAINGTGNTLDNVLIGNSGNNTLTGLGGNDTLDPGSAGTDTLVGGLGNDIYTVTRTTGITITEAAGEGTDLVNASVTYTLGNNLENLTLTGTSALNGTGNTLDNILTGNSGNNTLTGLAGNDTFDPGSAGTDVLVGGQGNDTYTVTRSTGITITEVANEGVDTVNASVTHTLAANVDVLFLTGSTAINGTGNALANLLRGNTGINTLAGGGGTDILEGGDGNDILSNTSGNTLLNGGAGIDTLTGTASNDLLVGGTGNDALTTGAGADLIVFNKGDGQDTVAASTTKDNTLALGGGAVYADLLFQKSGNDLILKVGATDQITFTGYYTSGANHSVDKLQVVIEGTSDYNSGSSDPTLNKKIETFNFDGLVAAFDAARAADPLLTTWALTNALTAQHLGGSDTAAIGGDLSYRYNRYGTLSDVSFTPAFGILGAAGFGSTAQTLQALASLQDSTPRLG